MEDYSFDSYLAESASMDVALYGITVEEVEHPTNGIAPISGDELKKLGAK